MRTKLSKNWRRNRYVYMMLIPVVAFYGIFRYIPYYGLTLAFKNYVPSLGILGSDWVGLQHFHAFFTNVYFVRVVRNTFLLSFLSLILGFPLPIIFALMLNEVRVSSFKRVVQTISYMPRFISLVVIVGLVVEFTSRQGLINQLLGFFGREPVQFMSKAEWFRPLYILSGLWQNTGWNAIIYLAALAGIDVTLYESAVIDGASRWRQTLHITLPGIKEVTVILFILRLGNLMNVGFEKVLLMYNPLTYSTADVISTYVYRRGIIDMSYGYTTAVGLLNSLIGFSLLVIANRLSKKYAETQLW